MSGSLGKESARVLVDGLLDGKDANTIMKEIARLERKAKMPCIELCITVKSPSMTEPLSNIVLYGLGEGWHADKGRIEEMAKESFAESLAIFLSEVSKAVAP